MGLWLSHCLYSWSCLIRLFGLTVQIESRPDCAEIQNELLEMTGGRSVPRVFIGGKFIGGGDETAKLVATGEMKQLLVDAGAL